MQKYIICDTGN